MELRIYRLIEARWGQYLVLMLIFSAGFFGYVMNTVDWFHAIPGDLVDARFNSIVLEHMYQWTQGDAVKLWSPTFFYPFEKVLAFSDNHFGSFWTYAIARVSGFSREYAFLAWFITGNLLNFWVSFYSLKRLGFSVVASAAGAFVFAFALPALPKEGHAQLIYRFASPLCFLYFYNFLENKKLDCFAKAVFWLALQFYCSIYIGIFLVYLLFSSTIACIFLKQRTFFREWLNAWYMLSRWSFIRSLGLICLSCFAIAWLLYHYHATAGHYGIRRPISEILSMIPTASAYLIADRSGLTGWIGGFVSDQSMRHEMQMFFGVGVSLIALLGIWKIWLFRSRQSVATVALLALMLMIAMTLAVRGHSFYQWLAYLPGVSSIRAVSRIILMMLLPLGIIVAFVADSVLRIKSLCLRWLLLFVLIGALVAETIYYQPYNTSLSAWTERQSNLRKLLPANIPADAILYLTNTSREPNSDVTEVDGVILAQDLNRSTLNGYSGNVPPGYFKPDVCRDFKDHLSAYFDFKPNAALNKEALSKRMLPITPEACPDVPATMNDKMFDAQSAKEIKLLITAVITDQTVRARILIKNESQELFSTLSKKGPVRLSWRIATVDNTGAIVKTPEFIARKDLSFSIAPGDSHVEVIEVNAPATPGIYVFQASLVQDGVAWFHDLGADMAQWQFVVK